MAALVASALSEDGVPYDTFGTRLAIVRQALGGWNVKRAAELCGIGDQTWRNWEAGVNKPQDYPVVCRKIADATGISYEWLMVGGPLLRSKCGLRGVAWAGQQELPYPVERALAAV